MLPRPSRDSPPRGLGESDAVSWITVTPYWTVLELPEAQQVRSGSSSAFSGEAGGLLPLQQGEWLRSAQPAQHRLRQTVRKVPSSRTADGTGTFCRAFSSLCRQNGNRFLFRVLAPRRAPQTPQEAPGRFCHRLTSSSAKYLLKKRAALAQKPGLHPSLSSLRLCGFPEPNLFSTADRNIFTKKEDKESQAP